MELIQISLKYFSFYEKFIFSVNRKPIFYGLTTMYVTNLLYWTVFQQITVRIQKKLTRSRNTAYFLVCLQWIFWWACHVRRHAYECACICFSRAFSSHFLLLGLNCTILWCIPIWLMLYWRGEDRDVRMLLRLSVLTGEHVNYSHIITKRSSPFTQFVITLLY